MRSVILISTIASLTLAGCSDSSVRVRPTSSLFASVQAYQSGRENRAADQKIQAEIDALLPAGSSEAKVLSHIASNYLGANLDREKGSPPWTHDYFYRIEAYRGRLEVWYFIKDEKLQRIHVANIWCSL